MTAGSGCWRGALRRQAGWAAAAPPCLTPRAPRRPAGVDGCGEPVSLLVHNGLTQSGAFVSPKVATLSRVDFNSLVGG